MHLERITLDPYGAFSDRHVDIGPGLTIVLGPNESGKSTLLAAIGDLLWGVASRSHPMAFRVKANQLRVCASVRDAKGTPRAVVVTTRGCADDGGEPVELWWTGGEIRTRESWRSALGLDRAALVSGGQAILESGGDLAPLLFRARTGVDLAAAADELTARAQVLFKAHKGNKGVSVRTGKADYDHARAAADAAVSSAATVEQRRSEEEAARSAARTADNDVAAAAARQDEAEELQRAWEPAHEVLRLRREVAGLESRGRALGADELAAYDEAAAAVTRGRNELRAADEKIAELTGSRDSYAAEESVLAVGERVDALVARETVIETARARLDDLADLQAQRRAAIRRVVAALAPERLAAPTGDEGGDDALVTAAISVLLPTDVVARIDAAERELRAATTEVEAQADLLEAARSAVEDAAGSEQSGGYDVEEARRRRTEAWHRIREPWLGGSLPDEVERQESAAALDEALVGSDAAADAAAERAHGAGQDEGRRAALAEAVTEAERRLDEARAEQEAAQQRWHGLLAESGLPPVLDPDAWAVRRTSLEELRTAVSELATGVEESARLTGEVADFDRAVAEVCTAAAGGDAALTWSRLTERLLAARQDVKAHTLVEQQLEAEQQRRDGLVRSIESHEGVLAGLTRPGEDLDEVVARSRDLLELTERLGEELRRLEAAARPGTDREDLIRRAGDLTQAEADLAVERAAEDLGRATLARDEARARERDATDARAEAERVGDAAQLNAVAVQSAEVLAGTVERYVELLVASALVRRMAEREGPQEDGSLLAHAATIARRLTAGRVSDIVVDTGDGTQTRLRVVADGLEDGTAGELSEGTADQVFLALRLAGIREQQERARRAGHVALPVVLDDVLMAHDDVRTEHALGALIDEARDQQIILTTHHRSVAEAAERLGATVVELDPLPDQSIGPIGPGGPAGTDRDRGDLDPATIRAWAREQGLEVSDKGRIPGWIVEAYRGRDTPDLDG